MTDFDLAAIQRARSSIKVAGYTFSDGPDVLRAMIHAGTRRQVDITIWREERPKDSTARETPSARKGSTHPGPTSRDAFEALLEEEWPADVPRPRIVTCAFTSVQSHHPCALVDDHTLVVLGGPQRDVANDAIRRYLTIWPQLRAKPTK